MFSSHFVTEYISSGNQSYLLKYHFAAIAGFKLLKTVCAVDENHLGSKQTKKIKDCLKWQLEFINSINLLNKHYQVHRPPSEGVSMEILDKIAEFGKLFQKQHESSIFDIF